MKTNKEIFLVVLVSFFLISLIFHTEINMHAAASNSAQAGENRLTNWKVSDAMSSLKSEGDQTVGGASQKNFDGEVQFARAQLTSISSNSSYARHMMCKDHDLYYNPIFPTTIFKPSDVRAVCLTTVSINYTIEFRWYYRSNASKAWISCFNWSAGALVTGDYHYAGYLLIAGYWPGYNYPRGFKVEVHLDGLLSFSEFFEVTNGGVNSPRMCKDVGANGHPVSVVSRFTIGADTKAYYYLRFDRIAYFNEKLGYCHNFTTIWIQPNGSHFKVYSGGFGDYKDTNATWNFWKFNFTQDNFIPIDSSTPVGNWKVEVYVDTYFNNTWTDYGPVATTTFILGSEPVADWTFMVYLDADNNLEPAGLEIFDKIASVTSSSQVNTIVQMDRIPGYDTRYGNWTDCKRFNITEGMTPTPGNATLHLGEVNMGHYNTLKDFVNWTMNNYPANYYSLVLWDHGTGCMGICFDITDSSDFLSLEEISHALEDQPAIVDVMILDACSMSMTEVAYQIKDCANVLVGPEGIGYAPAPYDDYLLSLIGNPSIEPNAFAKEIVFDYIEWCEPISQIQNATMSATDLTNITSLITVVDDFALLLKERETSYNHLTDLARNLTEGYKGPYANQTGYYIDLYNFAHLTYQYIVDEELQNICDQAKATLESIMIAKRNISQPYSHGLSIYFPDKEQKYFYNNFDTLYEETTFVKDTRWDEFLKFHLEHQHERFITVKSSYGDPTQSQWVNEGANLTVTVNSPTETIPLQTQWNCTGYRVDDGDIQNGTIYSFENVQAPHKIEFHWTQQYWLQVNTTESSSTVDGTGWYDNRTSASFSATTPHQLNTTHRFVFTFWNSTGTNNAPIANASSSISMVTMNNYYQILANWQQQYHLEVNTAYALPIGQGWYNPGAQAIFSVESPIDHGNGTRRIFIQWTGGSNATTTIANITMNCPHTVIAKWKTQHYFTVSVDPSVIPAISGDGWYDNGTIAVTGIAESVIHGVGVRYVFLTWVVDDSNATGNPAWITMDSSYTAIARYKAVYSSSIPQLSLPLYRIEIGKVVAISGYITPLQQGVIVTLTYIRPDGSVMNRTVLTSSDGTFIDTYTPDVAGSWNVTASWPGDGNNDGATSAPVSFTVISAAWWETFLGLDMLQFIMAFAGIAISVALIGIASVRTHKKRNIMKALFNEIDEAYSRFKTNPKRCEEELGKCRKTISEMLTDGKITEESYGLLDKKIDTHMEAIRKQRWSTRKKKAK